MNWVKDFNDRQFSWSKEQTNANLALLNDYLVDKMERFIDDSAPKKLLELGGGGGQFAVAASPKGYEVTVIELAPAAVEHIYQLAKKHNVSDNLQVIRGDFYQVELDEQFDIICYWDGFGIGSDSDQQILLERVFHWLKPNGTAFIDIYTPWYWANAAGREMQIGSIDRKYDFDANECRMIDTWWLNNDKDEKITQSLRCYSPADLRLLLKNIGLHVVHCEHGGAMDYEKSQYHEQVGLDEAMTFLAQLQKDGKMDSRK